MGWRSARLRRRALALKAGSEWELAAMRSSATRICLALLLGAAPARASAGWTFCVAAAPGGKEVWITDVFAASRERERLEVDLKGFLKTQGVAGAVAQCPLPKDDKIEVVNAQFTAAEFNRKLGHTLHDVAAPEFEPRR
jgi:hypothetical protein